MKTKIAKTLVAVGLVICLVLAFAMPASAAGSPPATVTVTGTMTTNVLVTDIRYYGSNMIWTATTTSIFSGFISGTVTEKDILLVKPTGELAGGGLQTFTGMVDGKSGSFTALNLGNGNSSRLKGTSTILGGKGGLSHLHGYVKWELTIYDSGTDTWSGNYCATIGLGR